MSRCVAEDRREAGVAAAAAKWVNRRIPANTRTLTRTSVDTTTHPVTPQEHYKTGLTYNGKGGEFADGLKAYGGGAAAAAAPVAAAAAPAPAAAAPAPTTTAAPPAAAAPASPAAANGGRPPNMAGLFAQISSIDQSSGRTAGLR